MRARLLRKSSGAFELIVWSGKTSGTNKITVDLGATHASARLYDPTTGTAPVRTLAHIRSVPLTLSGHPVVIEIPRSL